jgi:acyl-coenzyme A synthetase/AMP-(fatty) acid ligase
MLPIAPTSDNIYENMQKTSPEALTTVPTFLDAWATEKDDEKIALLKNLRYISFGGGPLTFEKGRFLVNKGVRLRNAYGGTEVCTYFPL